MLLTVRSLLCVIVDVVVGFMDSCQLMLALRPRYLSVY